MTIPALSNCQHTGDGWCLDCVRILHNDIRRRELLAAAKLAQRITVEAYHLTGGNPENPYLRLGDLIDAIMRILDEEAPT